MTVQNSGRASRGGWRRVVVGAWLGALAVAGIGIAVAIGGVDTTREDFFIPGTQINKLRERVVTASTCAACHGYYDPMTEPLSLWAGSMMGQATRDPIFHACMSVANQDASFAGDLCLRCHAPGGWLMGRAQDPTGGDLIDVDYQGVSCNVCHRLVDPIYTEGQSPAVDQSILSGITVPVTTPHSGSMIVDPYDRRRGPFDVGYIDPHPWLESPYHRQSRMCATCHDVSNPAYERQANGTYALGELDTPNPSTNKYDQFPMERTFSEWSASLFANGPVNMQGRFGGNRTAVSTCQDCHMPSVTGTGCNPGMGPVVRNDMPRHFFAGANTWVIRAVRNLYDDGETFLDPFLVEESIGRAQEMLQLASDLEVSQVGRFLNARIYNYSGHKLPTGYAEGRRMWVNVKYFDGSDNVIDERGAYNDATAELTGDNTKVYEAVMGLDAIVAGATGLPEGPGFHFALNNMYYKDNRIPPMGFTNAGFAAVQAAPIAASYADGQYWDDTLYDIPNGAVRAEVRVFHQVTTKEYIEFLRDANHTNSTGQVAYDQWALNGKSPPTEMDVVSIDINTCIADINSDGGVDGSDVEAFFTAWEAAAPMADLNADGGIDGGDVEAFFTIWELGC